MELELQACLPLENSSESILREIFIQEEPRVELLTEPKYYLALVSLFSNEARFLKEWIEFHLLTGVEHFYLYNHNSKDNYMEILQPYIDKNIVELENITYVPVNELDWYYSIHFPTYKNLTKKIAQEVEWLVVIDSDEFIYPVRSYNISAILKNYDSYASLSVNWHVFGSSNIDKIGEDELLIEKLTNHGYDNDFYVQNEHVRTVVKTIVKPRYVVDYYTPHSAELLPGYRQINENFQDFYGPSSPYKTNNIITINHYVFRDLEFFRTKKLERVHLLNTDLNQSAREEKINQLIQLNWNLSRVYDNKILKYVPLLKEKLLKNGE